MNPFKFFALNFLGALVWAASVGYLGYQFGHLAEAMMGKIQKYEMYILAFIVAVGLFLFWRTTLNGKKK